MMFMGCRRSALCAPAGNDVKRILIDLNSL